MDYIRLAPEALKDIERVICEAGKHSLHQQMDEQERLIKSINRAEATQLLGAICQKLEENNTALRVLATQVHKLQDALMQQTALVEKLLSSQTEEN